jgi:hypothetical protein
MHPADQQEFDLLNAERHRLRKENYAQRKTMIDQAERIKYLEGKLLEMSEEMKGLINEPWKV